MIEIKFKIPFFDKYIHINNSSFASPQEWLMRLLNRGTESAAGIEVNANEALRISTVYLCVKLVAETVAYLNCVLYKRDDKGKHKATGHSLYSILHDLPNPETIAFDFWVMYIVNLILTGDAFAFIKRDASGRIKELWNIPTKNVIIYRNEKTNELFYEIRGITADGEKNPIYYPENIMHTRGMRFDNRDKSLDPIVLARDALGLGIALEKYSSKYFANGAQAGGIVEYPEGLSDLAFNRFKKEFQENYAGVMNSNKLMFLEDGAKYTAVTNKPDESQALESRQFQVIEVCRFFNVPPHKVMDLTHATFSNIEEQNIDFVISCISPMCKRLEQTIYKDLLRTERERKFLFAKFLTNALLRGNTEARKEYYNTMIQNGVYSPNEVRILEDMNTYDGGDIHMVNGNMIPVADVGKQFEKGGENIEQN